MSNLQLYKFLGAVSYPLYRFAHPIFFWLYAVYKSKTDKFKLALLKQYVKPGHIVMDIGAHIGFYSLALANLTGESGHVIAFEPDRTNFQFLRKNTKKFSQISINQKAVGATSGMLKLFRSR
ncbi:MAG: FkbM family methyltransferase, partial [bacterium]|nr:FkbM family methyltransferase [bacterium]